MKHIKFLTIAFALVMAFVACAPAQAGDKAAETGSVLTPQSDQQLRPGMKPETVTVIDFNATWCGPCRYFSPIFHKTAEKFPKVNFYSVDTDQYPETANAFGISAIPTIIIISPDGKTKTIVGIGEELTDGLTDDATDEQAEQIIYDNFCKLITKATK